MKTLILAAFIVTIGLASCSVTEPNDRYYPRESVYSSSTYDPYYNPYDSRYTAVRRVYDYNTGRYYDVPVYSSAPVYSTPAYPNRTYRNDSYRRDNYRRDSRSDSYRDNYRRSYPQPVYQQPPVQQPQVSQPKEKRYPDGTRISPDGTVTLPNGQVRRRQ